MSRESWWVVCVRDWGSVAILGSETQAEDFRVHKARWEHCPAWKLRVRDATTVEVDEFMGARDSESGIVTRDLVLPADVAHFERMESLPFMQAASAAKRPSALPTLALTLIQPWGSLIMLTEDFRKDLENRTWAPSPGQLRAGDRLWIHAGKKLDTDTFFVYDDLLPFTEADIPRGALLGHVRLEGTVTVSSSPWFMGPIGWCLTDPVPLSKPIPCKGAQGLWRVPADVLDLARVDLEGRAA